MQEVHDTMDLEMQQLPSPQMDGSSAVEIMNTAIHTVKSMKLSITGTNHQCPSVSRASSYKSVNSSSEKDESKSEVAEASDCVAVSSEHHIDIGVEQTVDQFQLSQSKTISKIVREKNLPTLQKFGGLSVVAHALRTDFSKGISDDEAIYRSRLHKFYQPAPTHRYFHLVWKAFKNKTILLLLLAAVMSLVFEIKEDGLENGCHDGVVVLIAVALLVFWDSIHKYWEEQRARKKLQKQRIKEGGVGKVHVIRDGEEKHICEPQLVCGDIVLLMKGCQVPADGLFVAGQGLEVDYGSAYIINKQNPFLSYGERVISGDARMVVTSLYMDTGWSEMMRKSTSQQYTRCKLETRIDKLNTCLHYTGLIISILITIVLFIRYQAGKMDDDNGYKPESVTEPAATRYFADIFRKIIKETKYSARALINLLTTEQDSQGVTKMASVTRICTDMFSDFTEDDMIVEKFIIGGEVISGCTTLFPNVVEALCDGIGTLKQPAFSHWAKDKLGFNREIMMQKREILKTKGVTLRTFFQGTEEPCGALIRGIDESEEMVEHFNGPLSRIECMCTHYYDSNGHTYPIDNTMRQVFKELDEEMQRKHLKTIAFACKRTESQALNGDELVLVAVLGLKEITKAKVGACRERGIETIMVSSKKTSVLRNFCLERGITIGDSESAVITGEAFRKYTDQERREKADEIRILGEALPSDKLLLVEILKEQGQVVAFLGQRTDEAPSLRAADVGIAIGEWSTMKARASCGIFIPDGSFSDLVRMVDSGKCIHHNIQSFLQLVLITTISSTLISFSETVLFGDVSLTTLQFVWVKLTLAVLGGLALLTKPSEDTCASLLPVSCRKSLITAEMIRNIVFQVLYQAMCSLTIELKGTAVVGTNQNMKTAVSNIFIFCQFFNQFNARELQKKNFFRGIHRHIEFWVAVITFIVFHAFFTIVQLILGYGARLNWKLWAGCVLVGAVTWLVDWLGKCISWFLKITFKRLRNLYIVLEASLCVLHVSFIWTVSSL
ncbi:hypothetical protein CTI12_AA275740 [Artemisia annua]|uniref:Cation-transporting P-type ATPase N-terminal domain-containing protein n=1 Tax=Artemisia annua TaxID=35608 RepID=A0A2U1NEM9_ARTAN|nr:hypothetical protein CTI12_AA275740 [Artemisia annua]